jgi:predicted chitinase
LFGDKRLLQNPDQVASNEDISWAVSFWFWKTNVGSKADVKHGKFGASTNYINGALECRGAYGEKAKKRYQIYVQVLSVFDPSSVPIESGCYN